MCVLHYSPPPSCNYPLILATALVIAPITVARVGWHLSNGHSWPVCWLPLNLSAWPRAVRDAPKKKCSLIMDFFQKGGGIRGNPKVLGHFLCTNHFGILGRKRGRVDQIQKFLGFFYPDFGWIWPKKCPKSSKKKSAYEKVSQKFQKSGGVHN